MATKFTRNTGSGDTSKVFVEAYKDNNLEAVCEAVTGILSTEGEATFTASNSITVTDTRVVSTSRILLCLPIKGTLDPTGAFWWVDSQTTGSFVIKSSNPEVAGTKIPYFVINQ